MSRRIVRVQVLLSFPYKLAAGESQRSRQQQSFFGCISKRLHDNPNPHEWNFIPEFDGPPGGRSQRRKQKRYEYSG